MIMWNFKSERKYGGKEISYRGIGDSRGIRSVSHRQPIVRQHHLHYQYHPYHGMRLTTPIPILWGARWSR